MPEARPLGLVSIFRRAYTCLPLIRKAARPRAQSLGISETSRRYPWCVGASFPVDHRRASTCCFSATKCRHTCCYTCVSQLSYRKNGSRNCSSAQRHLETRLVLIHNFLALQHLSLVPPASSPCKDTYEVILSTAMGNVGATSRGANRIRPSHTMCIALTLVS